MLSRAWTLRDKQIIFSGPNMGVDQGKSYTGVPGDFAPEMQKKKTSKIKREPLEIAIDCNVKACSMLQISQWDVKSSPRK